MTGKRTGGCDRYAYAAWIFGVIVFLCVFAFSEARDTEELDANECMELEVYSGRFVPCCGFHTDSETYTYCELPDGRSFTIDERGRG